MRWLVTLLLGLAAAPAVAAGPELVAIPGGPFTMGDATGEPDEKPRTTTVAPFRLMTHEVTNAQFAAFTAATGYVTDRGRDGWGWVWLGRWTKIAGADWRHPHGPASGIAGKDDHPALQVSQRDAKAFCRYHGLRLPLDAEWEFAARGTDGRRYPWGDEPPRAGDGRADFGNTRCCAPGGQDGYRRTSPVGRHPKGASPFGVEDMAGSVWEWVQEIHPNETGRTIIRGGGWGNGAYCLRVSYRHSNPVHFGLDMVGFRCAGDAE